MSSSARSEVGVGVNAETGATANVPVLTGNTITFSYNTAGNGINITVLTETLMKDTL